MTTPSAMDDSALVRIFERIRYLSSDADNFIDGNRSSFDAVSERRPLDQFHH